MPRTCSTAKSGFGSGSFTPLKRKIRSRFSIPTAMLVYLCDEIAIFAGNIDEVIPRPSCLEPLSSNILGLGRWSLLEICWTRLRLCAGTFNRQLTLVFLLAGIGAAILWRILERTVLLRALGWRDDVSLDGYLAGSCVLAPAGFPICAPRVQVSR